MTSKLAKDSLLSDLKAVEANLASLPAASITSRYAFEKRRDELQRKISQLEAVPDTLASVALFFDGGPVDGSRAIDAEFAANVLGNFQDLVSKKLATRETGGLAQRGPVPSKDISRLSITSLVHGSFGFLLEEKDSREPPFIASPLKVAVDEVTGILDDISNPSEEKFSGALERMDARMFSSVKRFVSALYNNDAVIRIVESEKDKKFDALAVERAFRRVEKASVFEDDLSLPGYLLGVIPIGRKFEFRIEQTGEVIRGDVGPKFSQSYLSQIERDASFIGHLRIAVIHKIIIDRPGMKTVTKYILRDLLEA